MNNKGYNTHPPFNWIRDEQTSGSVDLLILLLNVLSYLLQHLKKRFGQTGDKHCRVNVRIILTSGMQWTEDGHCNLLIASLHAEEDQISRDTCQTALQVGMASNLFCLCIKVVQCLHSVLKQSQFNLQTHYEPQASMNVV